MKLKSNNRSLFCLNAAILMLVTIPASAGLIYQDFTHAGGDSINYTVTIEHDVVDEEFDVTYSVQASSPNKVGKFTGFFFDLSDSYNASNLGLAKQSNPNDKDSCGQAFGDVKSVINGGCNSTLNIGGGLLPPGFDGLFDVGIAWKVNDLTSGQMGSFSINDLGLSLDDWGAIGLRGQETSGNEGSAKEFQLSADVPEPSILALFAAGVLGMRFTRRNQSQ